MLDEPEIIYRIHKVLRKVFVVNMACIIAVLVYRFVFAESLEMVVYAQRAIIFLLALALINAVIYFLLYRRVIRLELEGFVGLMEISVNGVDNAVKECRDYPERIRNYCMTSNDTVRCLIETLEDYKFYR